MVHMSDPDDLRARIRKAAEYYHQLREKLDAARETLQPLVVEALKHPDIKQRDVVADSGLTREYIRRVSRDAGIEAAPRGTSGE